MAHLTNHAESDLMRAITHTRMLVTSGQGLESIIHTLAESQLGTVSSAMRAVENETNQGVDAPTALQNISDKIDNENIRAFLQALRANGASAISRLDDLSVAVQAGWNQAAQAYGDYVTRIISMVAIIYLGSFLPTFLRVLDRIPPNPMGIEFDFPDSLEAMLFTFMACCFGILTIMLRFR